MKRLTQYDHRLVRAVTADGMTLEGFAEHCSASYCMHEYGIDEECLQFDDYLVRGSEIVTIEDLGLRRVIKEFGELTPHELYAILKLRVDVFVVEQQCPYRELDGLDQRAEHIWLEDDGGIQAYLRVLRPGVEADCFAIGRVVTARRGSGLGRLILAEGIAYIENEFDASRIYLEAQTYAKGFYEKMGFRQVSDEFVIDGIPHIKMIRERPEDEE